MTHTYSSVVVDLKKLFNKQHKVKKQTLYSSVYFKVLSIAREHQVIRSERKCLPVSEHI